MSSRQEVTSETLGARCDARQAGVRVGDMQMTSRRYAIVLIGIFVIACASPPAIGTSVSVESGAASPTGQVPPQQSPLAVATASVAPTPPTRTTPPTEPPMLPGTVTVHPEQRPFGGWRALLQFNNPNPYSIDWSLTLRLRDALGNFIRDETLSSSKQTDLSTATHPIPGGGRAYWVALQAASRVEQRDVVRFTAERSLFQASSDAWVVVPDRTNMQFGAHSFSSEATPRGTFFGDVTLRAVRDGGTSVYLAVVVRDSAGKVLTIATPNATVMATLPVGERRTMRVTSGEWFQAVPAQYPPQYEFLTYLFLPPSVR